MSFLQMKNTYSLICCYFNIGQNAYWWEMWVDCVPVWSVIDTSAVAAAEPGRYSFLPGVVYSKNALELLSVKTEANIL